MLARSGLVGCVSKLSLLVALRSRSRLCEHCDLVKIALISDNPHDRSEASQPCFHIGIFPYKRLNAVYASFVLGVQGEGCARVADFVDAA